MQLKLRIRELTVTSGREATGEQVRRWCEAAVDDIHSCGGLRAGAGGRGALGSSSGLLYGWKARTNNISFVTTVVEGALSVVVVVEVVVVVARAVCKAAGATSAQATLSGSCSPGDPLTRTYTQSIAGKNNKTWSSRSDCCKDCWLKRRPAERNCLSVAARRLEYLLSPLLFQRF